MIDMQNILIHTPICLSSIPFYDYLYFFLFFFCWYLLPKELARSHNSTGSVHLGFPVLGHSRIGLNTQKVSFTGYISDPSNWTNVCV